MIPPVNHQGVAVGAHVVTGWGAPGYSAPMLVNAFLLTVDGNTLLNQQSADTWLCSEPADQDTCARVAAPRWEASGDRWTLTGREGAQRAIVL